MAPSDESTVLDPPSPAPPAAGSGEPSEGPRPRRRRVPIWLRVVATLLALVVALGGFYVVRAVLAATQVKRDDTILLGYDGRPTAGLGLNFLVIGTHEQSAHEGADLVMLVHLNRDRSRAYLVSLPRNLYVQSTDGQAPLATIAEHGGKAALARAVESLVAVRIDHVATVDFKGFIGLVDALGGVQVNNPRASTTSNGISFAAGDITIRGQAALSYVADDDPTLPDREQVLAARQRSLVRAILLKALNPVTLANPITFDAVVKQLGGFVTVDSGLTNSALWDLATGTHLQSSSDVMGAQPPNRGTATSLAGEPITLVDAAKLAELATALRSDTMDAYRTKYPA